MPTPDVASARLFCGLYNKSRLLLVEKPLHSKWTNYLGAGHISFPILGAGLSNFVPN